MNGAVYIVLELLISVCSVLGNVLVCWAVFINSNLQTITNYFVVSLAAADIAVGVLAIPFSIVISTGFCSSFYGCLFIACFVLVLTQGSIFSLLAIAVDRYVAIRIPLRSAAHAHTLSGAPPLSGHRGSDDADQQSVFSVPALSQAPATRWEGGGAAASPARPTSQECERGRGRGRSQSRSLTSQPLSHTEASMLLKID